MFAVFVIYIPPNIRNQDMEDICDTWATEIAAVKVSYGDPVILVGGDFNHWDITEALGGPVEFDQVVTGPTRGANTLDILYTNIQSRIIEQVVLPSLRSACGVPSDHQCVYAAAAFPEES